LYYCILKAIYVGSDNCDFNKDPNSDGQPDESDGKSDDDSENSENNKKNSECNSISSKWKMFLVRYNLCHFYSKYLHFHNLKKNWFWKFWQ